MSSWADILHDYVEHDGAAARKRILVTGAAGFIGSHLVDYHLAHGDMVFAVDDLSTGLRENLADHADNPYFRFIEADVCTWPALPEAVSWADRVYHLAAIVGVKRVLADPVATIDINLNATRRVLDLAMKCEWKPRVVIASSSEVYGFNEAPQFAETDDLVFHSKDFTRWAYSFAKLGDEFFADLYHDRYGLAVTSVRLFNTIGPRQRGTYGMVVPNFVHQAVTGAPLTVFGSGAQTRSFCDVRDTVRGLAAIASSQETIGKVLNLGNDREISILDLAKLAKEIAGSNSAIQFKSYRDAYGQEFDDIQHRVPDLSLLRSLTSFAHNWTLEQTLADLVKRENALAQWAAAAQAVPQVSR